MSEREVYIVGVVGANIGISSRIAKHYQHLHPEGRKKAQRKKGVHLTKRPSQAHPYTVVSERRTTPPHSDLYCSAVGAI